MNENRAHPVSYGEQLAGVIGLALVISWTLALLFAGQWADAVEPPVVGFAAWGVYGLVRDFRKKIRGDRQP